MLSNQQFNIAATYLQLRLSSSGLPAALSVQRQAGEDVTLILVKAIPCLLRVTQPQPPASAAVLQNEDDEVACVLDPNINFYDYSICYHPSFQVPVLHLKGYTSGGSPLSTDQVEADFSCCLSHYSQQVAKGWPLVSRELHPVDQTPWLMLHPCMTAHVMKLLVQPVVQDDAQQVQDVEGAEIPDIDDVEARSTDMTHNDEISFSMAPSAEYTDVMVSDKDLLRYICLWYNLAGPLVNLPQLQGVPELVQQEPTQCGMPGSASQDEGEAHFLRHRIW